MLSRQWSAYWINRELRESESLVVLENLSEAVPAVLGLQVENLEIKSDELGVIFLDESVDGRFELIAIECLRKCAVDGSFSVVLDAHAIAEGDEKFLLPLHEVDLEEVLADGVARTELQSLVKPCNLIRYRFFLYENGTKMAVGGEGRDG